MKGSKFFYYYYYCFTSHQRFTVGTGDGQHSAVEAKVVVTTSQTSTKLSLGVLGLAIIK